MMFVWHSTRSDGALPTERLVSLEGVRVGVPWGVIEAVALGDKVASQFNRDLELFGDLGAQVTPLRLPSWIDAAKATFILLYGLHFGRYEPLLTSPRSGLGTSALQRLMAGAFVTPGDLARCQTLRSALQSELETSMATTGVDVIVTPVVLTAGPSEHQHRSRSPGFAEGVVFTAPVNLVGWPAVSVPGAWSEGAAPLGVQLLAGPRRDGWLLDVASLLVAGSEWEPGQLHSARSCRYD